MTREERGDLFVEEENLDKEVNRIHGLLVSRGKLMEGFGRKLQEKPGQVVFANAPESLGDRPMELLREPSFDWNGAAEALDLPHTAQLIQDYRSALKRLQDVRGRLGK